MKLETWHTKETKVGYRLIRLDTFEEVPADEIVEANEETGRATVIKDGKTLEWDFGAHGLRISEINRFGGARRSDAV